MKPETQNQPNKCIQQNTISSSAVNRWKRNFQLSKGKMEENACMHASFMPLKIFRSFSSGEAVVCEFIQVGT